MREYFSLLVAVFLLVFSMFSPTACRYVSKTAPKTQVEFDYDRPSMKTSVPGPRSQVMPRHKCTHISKFQPFLRHYSIKLFFYL